MSTFQFCSPCKQRLERRQRNKMGKRMRSSSSNTSPCSLSFYLLLTTILLQTQSHLVNGRYVSYEKPRDYAEGESISFLANKLTSQKALSAMDYTNLPLCQQQSANSLHPRRPASSQWQEAVQALHGDAFREGTVFSLPMLHNQFCQQLCILDLTDPVPQQHWQDAVRKEFGYNWIVDGLPVIYLDEDDYTITTKVWGGIPVGTIEGQEEGQQPSDGNSHITNNNSTTTSSRNQVLLYNHLHFIIEYLNVSDGRYRVYRVVIHPYSIQHTFQDTASLPTTITSSVPACMYNDRYVTYEQAVLIPHQPAEGKILLTFDVEWIQHSKNAHDSKTRWSEFLDNNGSIPVAVILLGVVLGVIINAILLISLWVWVMRDLSYKPIMMEVEPDNISEEQHREMQLWPLSHKIFYPPAFAPHFLTILCGTGSQLLFSGLVFVTLFRVGIVNQSMGATTVGVAMIIYVCMSPVGGFNADWLCRLFHLSKLETIQACLFLAVLYPFMGIVVIFLVYDVLPASLSPQYNALSSSLPLILLWLFGAIPLTLLGGFFGYRKDHMRNFPMTEGANGYHDLALQDLATLDAEWKQRSLCNRRLRLPVLFLVGGFLPIATSFVEYAYGVAGPIFVGYYAEHESAIVCSYILFLTASGAVSALLYYKQLRVQHFYWWWGAFVTGASSGFYLFLLSMSWLLYNATNYHVDGRTLFLYILWFMYGCLGVSLITGFVGVAACILFNRLLYSFIMRRLEMENNEGFSVASPANYAE